MQRLAARFPRAVLFMEYGGAALSLTGYLLLATGAAQATEALPWGVWIGAALLFMLWSCARKSWGIFWMNSAYLLINIVGFVRVLTH